MRVSASNAPAAWPNHPGIAGTAGTVSCAGRRTARMSVMRSKGTGRAWMAAAGLVPGEVFGRIFSAMGSVVRVL